MRQDKDSFALIVVTIVASYCIERYFTGATISDAIAKNYSSLGTSLKPEIEH